MKRFEVWLVELDPTVGSEMSKTRPAVIVSPDALNRKLKTVTIVPLTTGKAFSFRIKTQSGGTPGLAALDQLRTVSKLRLIRHLDTLDPATARAILTGLSHMFAP